MSYLEHYQRQFEALMREVESDPEIQELCNLVGIHLDHPLPDPRLDSPEARRLLEQQLLEEFRRGS